MLKEIIKKYESFSDALISNINLSYINGSVEVKIRCMNALNNYEFEVIKLRFSDIVSFNFRDNENQTSAVINSALIENNNGIILFDFFPLIYGDYDLKENKDSDFKIKCRKISYVLIE